MDKRVELAVIRRAYAKQVLAAAGVTEPRIEAAYASRSRFRRWRWHVCTAAAQRNGTTGTSWPLGRPLLAEPGGHLLGRCLVGPPLIGGACH
jgi:hypothetical protein